MSPLDPGLSFILGHEIEHNISYRPPCCSMYSKQSQTNQFFAQKKKFKSTKQIEKRKKFVQSTCIFYLEIFFIFLSFLNQHTTKYCCFFYSKFSVMIKLIVHNQRKNKKKNKRKLSKKFLSSMSYMQFKETYAEFIITISLRLLFFLQIAHIFIYFCIEMKFAARQQQKLYFQINVCMQIASVN